MRLRLAHRHHVAPCAVPCHWARITNWILLILCQSVEKERLGHIQELRGPISRCPRVPWLFLTGQLRPVPHVKFVKQRLYSINHTRTPQRQRGDDKLRDRAHLALRLAVHTPQQSI